MNFFILENKDGKELFTWSNEINSLPLETRAFTYYNQENLDELGCATKKEFRIGIPVKLIFEDPDLRINLESITDAKDRDDIYCMYINNEKRNFTPINSNVTIVKDFAELNDNFNMIINSIKLSRTKKV